MKSIYINYGTCKASSLVGNIINPLTPTIVECSFNRLIRGITNAAVLPDPVFEQAIMSLPPIMRGIAY